ncbi:unnamed protein product [Dovyalis caffra]|uniref:Uncharacterized protein n=1 Tax=Dovyalis caffra TaxID=77055 RepID=A0AAV1R4P2_9ROSI|nr:unnamed protein product [Dovyalis caffra]
MEGMDLRFQCMERHFDEIVEDEFVLSEPPRFPGHGRRGYGRGYGHNIGYGCADYDTNEFKLKVDISHFKRGINVKEFLRAACESHRSNICPRRKTVVNIMNNGNGEDDEVFYGLDGDGGDEYRNEDEDVRNYVNGREVGGALRGFVKRFDGPTYGTFCYKVTYGLSKLRPVENARNSAKNRALSRSGISLVKLLGASHDAYERFVNNIKIISERAWLATSMLGGLDDLIVEGFKTLVVRPNSKPTPKKVRRHFLIDSLWPTSLEHRWRRLEDVEIALY